MVLERERVLFIINPKSGPKFVKDLERRIEKTLDSRRFIAIFELTKHAKHATSLAKDYIENGVNRIVAVGGDGTVNEVASALIHTDAILGVIPTGSGNGFARHLRIPSEVERAVRVINRGTVSLIDIGMANDQPFCCTTGFGFDAEVGHVFSQGRKRGFVSYIKSTIKVFLKYKAKNYKLSINDHSIEREAFLLTVANISQYGNNAYIAPNADITDGLLDVTILAPFPSYASASLGLKLFRRQLSKSKYAETFRVKELTVEQLDTSRLHYDGEPIAIDGPIKFSIASLALKVFVP